MNHKPDLPDGDDERALRLKPAAEPTGAGGRKAWFRSACIFVLITGVMAFVSESEWALGVCRRDRPAINIWYGAEQRFGHLGIPQRWVNVLGSVSNPERVAKLTYSLNGRPERKLSMGKDRFRLAEPGDFNIEIDYRDLRAGQNSVTVAVTDILGSRRSKSVTVHFTPGQRWPLPYSIDWSKVAAIQDVAQIVDGRWSLEPDGIRTLAPSYDRILAIGDISWTDYEVTVKVTFHSFDDSTTRGGVTHAGIGLRWEGHRTDGKQPRVKWYPLGAATEFTLLPELQKCRWRILGDNLKKAYAADPFTIALGKAYFLKSEVRTLPDNTTQYRVKIWDAEMPEPPAWALVTTEGSDDEKSGSALLVAHYSDVTFGNVSVKPVESSR